VHIETTSSLLCWFEWKKLNSDVNIECHFE
jgi:hypothetical protein